MSERLTCDAYNDAGDDSCDAPATRGVLDAETREMYPVCDRHYEREVAHQLWEAERP
jgi:hypothetical protein